MQLKGFGNAVVIGGSMAGLLAARVLAERFDTVSVIERDNHAAQPEARRGVPQGRHAHALLLRGQHTILRLFPEVRQALVDAGAHIANVGRDMRWYHFGVWKCRYDSALDAIFASRPLFEWTIGEHLRRLPNVRHLDGWSVDELVYDGRRITGVRARPRHQHTGGELLPADLVVDASGRGSQTPAQLAAFGFPAPPETTIKIDASYSTRIYRIPAGVRDWKTLYVVSQLPAKRGGLVFPLEGQRWIATLTGMHGDHPPDDERSFLEFARSLPVPDMYDALVRAEPLSGITRYGYPTCLRRHYEKLKRFPPGLLVLGDALCSFNPIYGQGMSVAAMYADTLAQCLQECVDSGQGLDDLWRPFFARAGKAADMPWQLSTSEDFRFPETVGPRSPALRLLHWYTSKVQAASENVPEVAERLYEVMHLLRAPPTLFAPSVLWKLVAPRAPRPWRAPSLTHGTEEGT